MLQPNKGIIPKATFTIVNRIGKKIKDLFRLEEVEVTFSNNKRSGYTYTVITRK